MNQFNYFGYASNFKQSLFEERIGNEQPLGVNVAQLHDYEFRFNHQQPNGEGRANITPKKDSYVYGIVYLITQNQLDYLLKSEPGYKMIEIKVQLVDDNKIVDAITFIDETANEENFTPPKEYLQTIVDGAEQHKVPQQYIDYIVAIANIKP